MIQLKNIINQLLKSSNSDKTELRHIADRNHKKNHDILTEWQFKSVMYQERKRTERSRSPMTVLFVNIEGAIDKKNVELVANEREKIIYAFSQCVRDTDFLGWYEREKVIGILFVDTAKQWEHLLIEKIEQVLEKTSSVQINGEFEIATCTFPIDNVNNCDSKIVTLYKNKSDTVGERAYQSVKRMMDIIGGIAGVLFFYQLF